MVDKALFIGMSGANSSMHELEILTNNLANANTTAFRADKEIIKSFKVNDNDQQSRVYAGMGETYTDFDQGPVLSTGRDLDIAIQGPGFIAVQNKAGEEAYTRAGDLELTEGGLLVTKSRNMVLGNGGVINIPPSTRVSIGPDGTITARLKGATDIVPVNRIKLVNPPVGQLYKGKDGLFYLAGEAGAAQPDPKIKILTGALEGSNVNTVETLTKLIDLSRHYDMHTNVMKTMSENSTSANQLLNIQR